MNLSKVERLNVYEMMLRDYRWSPMCFTDWHKVKKNTSLGFCYWLIQNGFKIDFLPELLQYNPTNNPCGGYWFLIGARRPRYKILQQAIAAVKKVI